MTYRCSTILRNEKIVAGGHLSLPSIRACPCASQTARERPPSCWSIELRGKRNILPGRQHPTGDFCRYRKRLPRTMVARTPTPRLPMHRSLPTHRGTRAKSHERLDAWFHASHRCDRLASPWLAVCSLFRSLRVLSSLLMARLPKAKPHQRLPRAHQLPRLPLPR